MTGDGRAARRQRLFFAAHDATLISTGAAAGAGLVGGHLAHLVAAMLLVSANISSKLFRSSSQGG
jgi:hypothetical protein